MRQERILEEMPEHVLRRTFERALERVTFLAPVVLATTITLSIDVILPKVIFISVLETFDKQAVGLVAVEKFIWEPVLLEARFTLRRGMSHSTTAFRTGQPVNRVEEGISLSISIIIAYRSRTY